MIKAGSFTMESISTQDMSTTQAHGHRIRKIKQFKLKCELRDKMSLSPDLLNIQNIDIS